MESTGKDAENTNGVGKAVEKKTNGAGNRVAFMRLPSVSVFSPGMQLKAGAQSSSSSRVLHFVHRSTSPMTAGGVRQSMITLTQTAFGGGVLTLAYGLRVAGVWLGLAFMIAAAVVSFIGMEIMMRAAVQMQIFSTGGLMARCLGRWSGILMDLLIFLQGIGFGIIYLILLGDLVPSLIITFMEAYPEVMNPEHMSIPLLRARCIIACTLVALPLTIPRKLSSLRYVSIVALNSIFFTAGTVVVEWVLHLRDGGGAHEVLDVLPRRANAHVLETFTLMLFAYNCHTNLVPVAAEMNNPTDRRIWKVNLRVVLVEITLYFSISVAGYLTYMEDTAPNILMNLGETRAATICRLLVSCMLLAGMPLQLNPALRSLMHLLEHCSASHNGLKEPLLEVEAPSSPGPEEAMLASPSSSEAPEEKQNCDPRRLLVSLPCLATSTMLAISVPNVATAVSAFGGIIGPVMMLIMPLLVLRNMDKGTFSTTGMVLRVATLVAGLLVCLGSNFSVLARFLS